MNDSESFEPTPGIARESNLREQLEGLRKLFVATLVALLILGVSLNVFLLRQTAFVRRDLQAARPQVAQMVANFEKAEEPQIKGFVNALVGFAKTHPDFKPILAKYNISAEVPTSTGATPALTPVTPKK